MAILNYFKPDKLTEELHIEGLSFIGKGYDWEVYEALTFAGAEQLKMGETDTGAGTGWCSPTDEGSGTTAEQIFNTYMIGQHIKLYYCVKEGTNKAFVAAIAHGNNVIKTPQGFKIKIQNYQLQDEEGADENSHEAALNFV